MEATLGGGRVDAYVAGASEPTRGILHAVRAALLGLGAVTERLVVDYGHREESPAFYVGPRQLCHVQISDDQVSVTISFSRALTFEVLKARDVPEAVRAAVQRTREYGATRWVNLPISSTGDLEGFLALARHKYRSLLPGDADELALPKKQRTLEQFA